jgi:hypothetical protein
MVSIFLKLIKGHDARLRYTQDPCIRYQVPNMRSLVCVKDSKPFECFGRERATSVNGYNHISSSQ